MEALYSVSNPRATTSCRCGVVEIEVTSMAPRVSTECCCDYCFHRIQCLSDLGGPSISDDPILNSEWDDRINVLGGRDLLFAYKMTEESQVVNVATTCCYTFLLSRHSVYDSNCLTTVYGPSKWKHADIPFPASSRWFSNQWSADCLAKYPPLVGIWSQGDGSLAGDPGWEEVFSKQMEAMQRPIPEDAEIGTESFDSLVDSIGRENIRIMSKSTTVK